MSRGEGDTCSPSNFANENALDTDFCSSGGPSMPIGPRPPFGGTRPGMGQSAPGNGPMGMGGGLGGMAPLE